MSRADTKFFIWARGRWRELFLTSGQVQGIGSAPVRFLYVKKGRLEAARGSKVLHALRSLAENKPTTVQDGPSLPQRRRVKVRVRRSRSRRHRHCCCSAHVNQCKVNLKEVAQNVHIQASTVPTSRADASIQVTGLDGDEIATNNELRVEFVQCPAKTTQAKVVPQVRAKRKRSPVPEVPHKRFVTRAGSCENQRLERERTQCKELLINEGDIDLYRTYLLKNDPNFDVYRFDTDDTFKIKLFYLINPLVSLTRCKRLESMLHERRLSQDTISLKDFATKLGLRSVFDKESFSQRYKMRKRTTVKAITSFTSDEGTDKENVVENKRKNVTIGNHQVDRTLRKRLMVEAVQRNISGASKSGVSDNASAVAMKKQSDALVGSSSSDSSREPAAQKSRFFTKKPVLRTNPLKISRQSSKTSVSSKGWSQGLRVYSQLEDQAIVAFVSGGDRARLVNGNRVWRELQDQYHRLTGEARSWHSLRNRYLRYILPALPTLALPPQQVSRLRAAASKGEIKARKRSFVPNPLCVVPRVKSAWAARAPPQPAPAPPYVRPL